MPFDDNDTDLEEEEDNIELKEVLKAIASLLCKVRGIARSSRKTNMSKNIYCQTFTLYSYVISKYANKKYSHVIHI